MNDDVYDHLPADTPMHILKKQVEIIQSLSYSKRLKIAGDLSDFCYRQTINMLQKKLNTTDKKLLTIAFVETVYKNDFSSEEMDRIKLFLSKNA